MGGGWWWELASLRLRNPCEIAICLLSPALSATYAASIFRASSPPATVCRHLAKSTMNRAGNYRAHAAENSSFKMLAGQPPQRPPSLGPNPALGGPFRTPYPQYGIPPRNVMPGYPALPNHRTTQNVVPQPSPNFIQQRGQSGFPFVGGIQHTSGHGNGS